MHVSRKTSPVPVTATPNAKAPESDSVVVDEKPRAYASKTASEQRVPHALTGRAVSSLPVTPAPTSSQTLLAARTAALGRETARSAQRYAAIDMGSSSAKLLVVEIGADGREKTLLDRKISTRLGADVPNGGAIPDENQARTTSAIAALRDDAVALGVSASDIALVTTAVMRNATNGGAFLDVIRHDLGLTRARILSGDDEAKWGYLGTVAAVAGAAPDDARFATLDLGGGSFQLAVGSTDSVEEGASTQVGSNTLLASVLAAEFLDDAAFARADAWLRANAPMPLDTALLAGRALVGTGGISKFLRVHTGTDVLTRASIDALRRELGALSFDARVPVVMGAKSDDEKRALGVDTEEGAKDFGKKITASSTLLLHIMDALGVDTLQVSETDTRHALVRELATERTAADA